jgi:hypothetical protein
METKEGRSKIEPSAFGATRMTAASIRIHPISPQDGVNLLNEILEGKGTCEPQ